MMAQPIMLIIIDLLDAENQERGMVAHQEG